MKESDKTSIGGKQTRWNSGNKHSKTTTGRQMTQAATKRGVRAMRCIIRIKTTLPLQYLRSEIENPIHTPFEYENRKCRANDPWLQVLKQ
jgi:hypothetical protein